MPIGARPPSNRGSSAPPARRLAFPGSEEFIVAGIVADGGDHVADGGVEAGEEGAADDGVADVQLAEMGDGKDVTLY